MNSIWIVICTYNEPLNYRQKQLETVVSSFDKAKEYAAYKIENCPGLVSVNVQGWHVDGLLFHDQMQAGNAKDAYQKAIKEATFHA